MNVFITGATGFVGRNLVDYLSAAYPELALYCLARNPEKAREIERPGVFIVPGDLHTPESYTSSVAQADIILHLAAMVGLKNGEAFYTANRDATQTLVNAAKHSERLKRFFYLSSIAAIDRPPSAAGKPQPPLTETDPPNPRTDYGTSKLQGEEALIDSGLPYSILRPAYIYGPYPRIGSSMDRAVHDVRQGRRYTRFPFPGRASEIFVGDLAKAVWLAATAPQAENQAFFIANEQPVIVGDFLQQLAEALHVPFSHRLHTPGEIARIRGFVQRRKPENPMLPILFEDYFTCSPQKFMTLTGYRPQDGLTRGLEKTVAWYRANGLLN